MAASMNGEQRNRRRLTAFVGLSCAAHALLLFCVPVGENREPLGRTVLREVKITSVEFIKQIRPKPKPKPRVVTKPRPRMQRPLVRRRYRLVRRVPRAPEQRPAEPQPVEAAVLPPRQPEEPVEVPTLPEDAPVPEPVKVEKSTPEPEAVVTPPEPLSPAPDLSEMVAMAPQPVSAGPVTTPATVDAAPQPERRIESPREPTAPSAPDLGNPSVTQPAPASGGDAKRRPQIGLEIGRENRSALPGVANRLGAPQSVAGPGGPVPVVPNPNPGGSPRIASLPRSQSPGPVVRRGVADGDLGAPGASRAAPGQPGLTGKRSPAPPGSRTGPTMGTGPGRTPAPGSGNRPGPAGPGQPVVVMTSPHGSTPAPPRGAGGRDAGGLGGGGGGEVVLLGGGGGDPFGGGPGGGGEPGGGGGGKSRPGLGSPWGGDTGEPLYARGGGGGGAPGDGNGDGVGTGQGDGAGPGSGPGEPILIAMAGPGGGYGTGDTPLPLGWPGGTDTTGAPGFPWLEPGLGIGGGGGEGPFGGPHGIGDGGGFPGLGGKLAPGFGGVPGGTGLDVPRPRLAGGGGGGGSDVPGGPGLFGPLTVGGPPGGTGTGLVAMARRGLGIPILPGSVTQPLLGLHGGPRGTASGTGAVGKGAPGGIYADLVGTFDVPVGVTNSDYNTDEVSVLNLLGTMRERTNVRVKVTSEYVSLDYEEIKNTPILWISGHRPLTWTAEERAALRKYVENGGTILAEDCHGPFNQVFPDEMRRIFGEELEPVPLEDELFKSFYVMDELPPGDVKERLPIRGLRMPDGRLGVIYSQNDYSDSWKIPRGSYVGDAEKEQAFRMGVNWYVYILAHWRRGHQAEPTTKLPGMP